MDRDKRNYIDLDVWKGARVLSKEVYLASSQFPSEEKFGLTSQIRRAVVSIPSNIAEGCGRNYPKDSIQFFYIPRGSIYEVETQLYLAFDLDFISETYLSVLLEKLETTRKLLNGFIKYYQTLVK
ncbi:four helix bundle protein [Pedobacter agri]|uniref:Four helix bundle protein n=1 Tax=Pedobacter agri TaxID=454586 RepID=A0A9X3DED0_9SPHI|nr:four helix bundle protein [Pedobacter agri]MCX3265747.1 four helix bundle protein [Pedobacter agri]